MSRSFTVIGFWRNGTRHVVGVVEGEQEVMSGLDVAGEGLFAEHVLDAVDADSACSMVHGTGQEDEEEEPGGHPYRESGSGFCGICDAMPGEGPHA